MDSIQFDRRRFLATLAAAGTAAGFSTGASAHHPAEQHVQYTDPLTSGSSSLPRTVTSPDGSISVTIENTSDGLSYRVTHDGTPLVESSSLGLEFGDGSTFGTNATVTGSATDTVEETWSPPWGRFSEIREHYSELAVSFDGSVPVTVTVRVFDDGVGFRYTVHGSGDFTITSENTEFAIASDGQAWWINNNPNKYEQHINETAISSVDAANTPITMRTDSGKYLAIHESDLTDYAAMRVASTDARTFQSDLVPWPDGQTKVEGTAPHVSPWRTLQIGARPGALIESNLIVNLAQEQKLADDSWIDPGKYMGIWWEIHIGKSSWVPGGNLGATTENIKHYMDFAGEHGIPNLLAEGWNVGWSGSGEGGFDDQDFTTAVDQLDLQEILDYGDQRGVRFVAHNETGAQARKYETQMETAYPFYQNNGIPAIKNGYVNPPVHEGYAQQSQWMVNHYRHMIRKAADNEIMINTHEPIKPTGERRTWPNFMTREGVRGLEYQNFVGGLPVEHEINVAFTRMLAGPVDYNPGIFDLTQDGYNVNTTRARQLGLYVIMFSGLQMVADLPENYVDDDGEVYPEFQFIKDVPVEWDETRVLDAAIGDYVTIARRNGGSWYVGTATAQDRDTELSLEFLESDVEYRAEVYTDAPDCDLDSNPEAVEVRDPVVVTDQDTIDTSMVRGGGGAIRLVPTSGDVPYCPSLTVEAPSQVDTETVSLAGQTEADDVQIETPGGEVLEPTLDSDGSFSLDVSLASGENTFSVSVPKQNADERCSQSVTVTRLDAVVAWSDPEGDDAGPGEYTYPQNGVFADGDFDLTGLRVVDQGSSYEIRATLPIEPTNPWGLADGFSKQYLQVYVRDPDASGGTTTPAPGVNATMAAPYQSRVLVDGENGVRVEDVDGNQVATGSVSVEGADLVVSVPRDAVGDLSTAEIATLLLGYDGTSDDNTRTVGSSAGEWTFGGADGENAPQVLDLLTPDGMTNADALAYSASQQASIPYLAVDGGSSDPDPQPLSITALDAPATATVGESVSVSATVENPGSVATTETVTASFDGSTIGSESLTVAGSSSKTVSFDLDLAGRSAGTYTVDVQTADDSASSEVTIQSQSTDGLTVSLTDAGSLGRGAATTVDIVVSGATDGIAGADLSVTVANTAVARIEDVSLTGSSGLRRTSVANDGSRCDAAFVSDTTIGAGDVTLGSVTISGVEAGSTSLSVSVDSIGTPDAESYDIAQTSGTALTVTQGIPPLVGDSAPTDPDGDGVYEDVNGDGTTDIADVQALLDSFDGQTAQDNAASFDVNEDGRLDVTDVIRLLSEL